MRWLLEGASVIKLPSVFTYELWDAQRSRVIRTTHDPLKVVIWAMTDIDLTTVVAAVAHKAGFEAEWRPLKDYLPVETAIPLESAAPAETPIPAKPKKARRARSKS